MRKSLVATLALAAGIAMSGIAAAPASALTAKPIAGVGSHGVQNHVVPVGHIGHGHIGGGHGFGGHQFHGNNFYGGGFHHRRHFSPFFYAAPVYAYSYRSHDDGCYWLKRKALNTGSRYWWHRYHECREG